MVKSEFISYGEEMEVILKEYFKNLVEEGWLKSIGKKKIAEMLGVDPSTVTRHFQPVSERGYHFDTITFFAYCKVAEVSPLEAIGHALVEYELRRKMPA